MKMTKMLTILMATAFACASSFADWSWSGRTGSVTIPSGTTATVSDGDVATVAALTAIEIESGGKLDFVNTITRCTLAAVLSGNGACHAEQGAKVTFAGQSPSYTGEMLFTNACVRVSASRYGLGAGTNSLGRTRYVFSNGSYNEKSAPNAEGLMFEGDGIICDPGIYWAGQRSSDARQYFVDNLQHHVVFNGPVMLNKRGAVDTILMGNFTFNAGLGLNSGTPQFVVGDGSLCVTSTVNNVAITGGSAYTPIMVAANAELHLNVSGITGGHIVFYGYGKTVCCAENVLPQNTACGLGRSSYKRGTIDLNGFDQSVKQLSGATNPSWAWNPARNQSDVNLVSVVSDKPATLTITGNVSPVPHMCRFLGKASLTQAGGGTYTMVSRYSDTEGTLTVTDGTVKFDWGAGWGGDIVVADGGCVILAEDCPQVVGRGSVVLAAGAKLAVSNNVRYVCNSLAVGGGDPLQDGDYTCANLGDYIEGGGTVVVKHDKTYDATYTWTGGGSGWSDSASWGGEGVPGANDKAVIPAGATVAVHDADVAGVAATSAIEVESGGKLEFVNTTTALTLSADLSGGGDIRSKNSAGITLAGDNLSHVGSMEFTNTPVYVTSRTGLGNPLRSVVHWGTGSGSDAPHFPLRFRGNGLTNDVPIAIVGQRHVAGRCFTDDLGDSWAQNGYVDYLKSSDTPSIWFGDYVFSGGLRNTQGSFQFYVKQGRTCTIRATPLSLRVNSNWSCFFLEANATLRVEVAGNQWSDKFSINGTGKMLCCAENVLDTSRAFCMARSSDLTTLDLNGNNQSCTYIRNSQAPSWAPSPYTPTRGSVGHGIVTSATPATLTMIANGDYFAALKFSGQASHSHTGTGTYTMVNQYSDTTGMLYVSAGAVKFDWGAGWGGDIAASGSGKVIFAEPCAQNKASTATGAVTLSDTAKLVVSNRVRYCCASLTMGGTTITQGRLTAADCPEWIEGGGVVQVGKPGFVLTYR